MTAQIGVTAGVHVKQAKMSVRADGLGYHGSHDSPMSPGLACQKHADMIVTGFKTVPFVFHCDAGQGAHAANQQPGGFPLGMRIDGNDSFRIPAGEAIFDLI